MPRPLIIDRISEQFRVHTIAQLKQSQGEDYFECVAVLPYEVGKTEDVDDVIDKIVGIKSLLSNMGVVIVHVTTIRFHHAVKWVMSARSACKEVVV